MKLQFRDYSIHNLLVVPFVIKGTFCDYLLVLYQHSLSNFIYFVVV